MGNERGGEGGGGGAGGGYLEFHVVRALSERSHEFFCTNRLAVTVWLVVTGLVTTILFVTAVVAHRRSRCHCGDSVDWKMAERRGARSTIISRLRCHRVIAPLVVTELVPSHKQLAAFMTREGHDCD